MKLSKEALKRIIKEELEATLGESTEDTMSQDQIAVENGLKVNPYGGRFYYEFKPIGDTGKGIFAVYHFEEQTGELEFASAQEVPDLDQELKRVAAL